MPLLHAIAVAGSELDDISTRASGGGGFILEDEKRWKEGTCGICKEALQDAEFEAFDIQFGATDGADSVLGEHVCQRTHLDIAHEGTSCLIQAGATELRDLSKLVRAEERITATIAGRIDT